MFSPTFSRLCWGAPSSAAPIWNDGHQVIHETFKIKGRTYSRGEYGLVWQRPNPEPVVFKKDRKEDFFGSLETIDQALSIDKRLYFYYSERDIARLVPLGAGPGYEISPPRRLFPQRIQLFDKPDRLPFVGTNDLTDEAVVVLIWDLHQETMATYDAPTDELFSARPGEYVPRAATKVE